MMFSYFIVFEGNDADNESERKISHITFRRQIDGEKKTYINSSLSGHSYRLSESVLCILCVWVNTG